MEVRLTSNLLMDIRFNFIKSPISINYAENFLLHASVTYISVNITERETVPLLRFTPL